MGSTTLHICNRCQKQLTGNTPQIDQLGNWIRVDFWRAMKYHDTPCTDLNTKLWCDHCWEEICKVVSQEGAR